MSKFVPLFSNNYEVLRKKLKEMERKYDLQFKVVFDAIREMLEPFSERR